MTGSPLSIGSLTMAPSKAAIGPWAIIAVVVWAAFWATCLAAVSAAGAGAAPSVTKLGFRASIGQGCQLMSVADRRAPTGRSRPATSTLAMGLAGAAATTTGGGTFFGATMPRTKNASTMATMAATAKMAMRTAPMNDYSRLPRGRPG